MRAEAMHEVLNRLGEIGIVPVVKIEKATNGRPGTRFIVAPGISSPSEIEMGLERLCERISEW
ncbi:MAG: hypothetical protein NT005_03800 [Spirochaetes bacterium]|nr:hypothetical protein [Spirochaetota bacterium]